MKDPNNIPDWVQLSTFYKIQMDVLSQTMCHSRRIIYVQTIKITLRVVNPKMTRCKKSGNPENCTYLRGNHPSFTLSFTTLLGNHFFRFMMTWNSKTQVGVLSVTSTFRARLQLSKGSPEVGEVVSTFRLRSMSDVEPQQKTSTDVVPEQSPFYFLK